VPFPELSKKPSQKKSNDIFLAQAIFWGPKTKKRALPSSDSSSRVGNEWAKAFVFSDPGAS